MARTIQLGDYQLRVLDGEEFNRLPYKGAAESLGLADPRRNMAFIRDTGLPEMDNMTMQHELEELLANVSPHEEDGIRYKKAKELLGPVSSVLSFVPGPWTPFAMAYSLGSGIYDIAKNGLTWQNALQVAPGALGAFKGFAQAGAGFGSKLGGALKGSVGIGGAKAPSTGTPNPVGPSPTAVGGNPLVSGTLQGAGTATAPSLNVSSGISQLSSSAAEAVRAAQAPKPTVMDNFKAGATDATKGIVKSAATQAVGEQLLPTQGQPIQQGTGALDAFAPAINTTAPAYTPLYGQGELDAGIQNIARNAEQRRTQAFDMFRRINPGTPIEGNTAFAQTLASIDESTNQAQQDFLKQAESANQDRYRSDTYNEIKRLNNLDDTAMQFYIELAQKPDSEIRPYISSDISKFKEVFGSLQGAA